MEDQRGKSIVMFPLMAQGHIIPFLALALKLEQRGYDIVFVNTPLNVEKLRQSLPPKSSVKLRELPFDSSDHGLPPGVENTDVLPSSLTVPFIQASATLKPAFRELLADLVKSGGHPLCVIADIFFGWSVEVAHEFGAFHVIFSGAGGFGLACYYSTWMNLPHLNNSGEFTLPDFQEAGVFDETYLTPTLLATNGNDPFAVFARENLSAWSDSDGVLFNTVAEIDEIGLDYFKRKLNKPIWSIGPVVLEDRRSRAGESNGINPQKCLNWLNSKPPNSVLYVSFGSMNTISASQMMQLAKALEATKRNFIWVVRPPVGYDIAGEFKAEEWLPEGFIRRVSGRGLIIEQWAPQVEILSNNAVGVFLSHCGWNSVLEALSRGVAVMGWPLAAEQFHNSKLLEEKIGVAVEVARGCKWEVKSEDLVEKMEMVMGETAKGKKMRNRAMEVKKMIEDAIVDGGGLKGSSVKAMYEFLDSALLMKKMKENGVN